MSNQNQSHAASFMVTFGGQQFGPHTSDEIEAMLASGMIDGSALVWCNGWPNWLPVSTVAKAPAPPPEDDPPATVLRAPPAPIRRRPRTYKERVGQRSYIFQIVLVVWTLSYVGCILAAWASAASHETNSVPPASSYESHATNPADVLLGVFSGWIALGMGWCVIGLPVGIAAVATLEDHRVIV
ncbi:MAG TPA: DUF4339 domain-containing protein [Tepidisphaeraceae bacterium]|nr:DUF4339 domain-containing protein [Tepidisphaeraceae bacterium]